MQYHYAREIDILVDDLKLRAITIQFKWYSGKYLRGKSGTGGNVKWDTVTGTATVSVATDDEYEAVVKSIAHELRHIWQILNHKMIYQWVQEPTKRTEGYWKYIWNGSRFVPEALTWTRLPHEERPHERDCYAYEQYAWEKLFRARQPTEPLTALRKLLRG